MISFVLTLYRRILPVSLPLLLIAGGYFALPHLHLLRDALPKTSLYLPLIVFIVTTILSLHFNLTRVAWVLLSFAIAYVGYGNLAGEKEREALRFAFALFLPLNITFFAFCKERGLLTLHGIFRLGLILGEAGLTLWVISEKKYELYHPLSKLALIKLPILDAVPIPQVLLAAFILFFLLLLLAVYLYRSPVENGFAGTSLTILAAIVYINQENAFIYFLTASGVILLVGVIRNVHYMAYRDELTGLMGRRALNERMLMLGRRYTAAMLDVDHFKKFNDTYGHDAGDQVLKMVAGRIKGVGGGGRPYRYGGEEFTILFPGKGADAAEPVLERLRIGIAESSIGLRGKDRTNSTMKGKAGRGAAKTAKRVSVKISIGLAERSGGVSANEVVKAADEALYRAKDKGRNCVSR